MKPCYKCNDRQLAAAGAAVAVASKAIPGAISAVGNAFANQKELQWIEPDCGSRPFFIGKRRNEWEQCVAKAQQQRQQFGIMPGTETATGKSFLSKNKTPLLIGGAIIAGLILFNKFSK
jgi:hypothetical protein